MGWSEAHMILQKVWCGFGVVRAGRKTRNSLAHSTRSLMARLELDSFYNEPAHFITC